MKKNKRTVKSRSAEKKENKKISRKEAIKKTGKYAALTAAATLIILSPKQSQAGTTPTDPGWGA